MTHTTEIVAYKKLSNGQYSYCIRCCGNASTDSWHTMDAATDPTSRAASISAARVRVATEHEATTQAETEIVEEMGKTAEHEV